MTQYHGGKQRLGKAISNIINDVIGNDYSKKGYCEPFCGMLGVYQHINVHPEMTYLAGDIDTDLISFWSSKTVFKDIIQRESYDLLKYDRSQKVARGFYGFYNGFCGKKFSGYFKNRDGAKELSRLSNSITRIENIHRRFPDLKFSEGDYTQYSDLKNYIIYCDPPYENRKQHYSEKFDSDKFYDWCEGMSNDNIVFVSSYEIPENREWKVVYEKSVSATCGTKVYDNKRIERLYQV